LQQRVKKSREPHFPSRVHWQVEFCKVKSRDSICGSGPTLYPSIGRVGNFRCEHHSAHSEYVRNRMRN
jgi:hypothetical protein